MANFIAIDVETANSDPATICQIGIAIYQAGELVKSYGHLVNPQCRFAAMNMGIHGITSEDVAGSPIFTEIFPPISDLISNYIVVSHTMFDRNAFQKACELSGITFPKYEWVDSSMIARRAWPDVAQRGFGLQNLCDRIGFDYDAHDAEEDAIACGEVVIAALNDTGWTFHQAVEKAQDKTNKKKWIGKKIARSGRKSGENYGKTVCFTGDLPVPRTAAARLAAQKGYEVKNGVSKKVDYLIIGAGSENTRKYKRALELQAQGHSIIIVSALQIFTVDEMVDVTEDTPGG